MNIDNVLDVFSCSSGEKSVFLTLLSSQTGLSVVGLNKKLGKPRPTLYGYVESLAEKGLVIKAIRDSGAVFYTQEAKHLEKILAEKINTLQNTKLAVPDLLAKYAQKEYSTPRFTAYEGGDAHERLFRDILVSREKEIFWLWPLAEMLKHVSEQDFFNFHTERIERGIWLHALWPRTQKVSLNKHPLLFPLKEKESLRKIRLLPAGIDQTIGYGCYGQKVSFISSERENYAFTIESPELSEMYKNHFQFLWKQSEKFSYK